MALNDPYARGDDYTEYKGRVSGADSAILALQLLAMSRVLDSKLGQPYGFNVDSTVTTVIYGPRDQTRPIASTAGLVVKRHAGTGPYDWASLPALTLDTDFELLPRNNLSLPEPRPYYDIAFTRSSPWGYSFKTDSNPKEYRVQVTAIHGWPGGVPPAIKMATIELTAMLRADSQFATGNIQQGAESFVDMSNQARALLNSLSGVYGRYGGVGVG